MPGKKTRTAKATSTAHSVEQAHKRIYTVRGQRVILDADLARFYGVTTKRLNQQVRRNLDRFPEDFLFRLELQEAEVLDTQTLRSQIAPLNAAATSTDGNVHPINIDGNDNSLRSQFATLKRGKHRKYRPFAFTEHGAIMAATILNSPQAVQASIFVVRAFIHLRELAASHQDLAEQIQELRREYSVHDSQIQNLFDYLNQILNPPDDPPKPPIGFHTELASPPTSAARPPRARRKLRA